MANEKSQDSSPGDHISCWQVFKDDWWLLSILVGAIVFISYTVHN